MVEFWISIPRYFIHGQPACCLPGGSSCRNSNANKRDDCRAPKMGMNERNIVCGIASLLVAFQEVLHAAIMLISEIIARAPTTGVNEYTVMYGTVSLLVVIQKALRVMTMLISEIIAQGSHERNDRTHCCVWDRQPTCFIPGRSSCSDSTRNHCPGQSYE